MTMITVGVSLIIMMFLISGFINRYLHVKRILSIPIRIIINGSRGKSTVTRMIIAVLQEQGLTVVGRTSGTAARHILPDRSEEEIIRIGNARIGEIVDTIKIAHAYRADAVVVECMALVPEYQKVIRDVLLRPTMGILTNIREDHLDIMGPTLEDVGKHMCLALPKKGVWITSTSTEFLSLIKKTAKKVQSTVMCASLQLPETEYYDHLFEDNIAITYAVSDYLGIGKKITLSGISRMQEDPGTYSCMTILTKYGTVGVMNAFSANDPDSTKILITKKLPKNWFEFPTVYVYNNRSDRIHRGISFCPFLAEQAKSEKTVRIILLGPATRLMYKKLHNLEVPKEKILQIPSLDYAKQSQYGNLQTTITERFLHGLSLDKNLLFSAIVIGIGNNAGEGQICIDSWKNEGTYA